MEIINDNRLPEENRTKCDGKRNKEAERCGHIYLGITLLLTGGLWLLHNFNLVGHRIWDFFISWEVLLVVVGGYLLATRKWTAGAIVAGIGMIFILVEQLDCYEINAWKIVLPAVLIAFGISLLVSRLRK